MKNEKIRDPYLRAIRKELNGIYVKVTNALIKEVYQLLIDDNNEDSKLEKSQDKNKLVRTEVIVNGKNGSYRSHRWKKPIENDIKIRLDKIEQKMYDYLFTKNTNKKLPRVVKDDRKDIKAMVNNGEIKVKTFYNRYKHFEREFKLGIQTKAGIIKNEEDRYFHIIAGHKKVLFNHEGVSRIVNTLKKPSSIYKAKDGKGISGICFLSEEKDKGLAVIVRDGNIITAYEPSPKNLNKIKKGECIYEH